MNIFPQTFVEVVVVKSRVKYGTMFHGDKYLHMCSFLFRVILSIHISSKNCITQICIWFFTMLSLKEVEQYVNGLSLWNVHVFCKLWFVLYLFLHRILLGICEKCGLQTVVGPTHWRWFYVYTNMSVAKKSK